MRLFGELLSNLVKACYTFLINFEEKSQGHATTLLLPLPDGLEITSISETEHEL
jgi:hypothetical protein